MTDLRGVLWEPCPRCLPLPSERALPFCSACHGTGRVPNQAAVRAVWALLDHAYQTASDYVGNEGAALSVWAEYTARLLEGMGAPRPKECCGAYAESWKELGRPAGWLGCPQPTGHTGNHGERRGQRGLDEDCADS